MDITYCATCGERQGSVYAKRCCTEDNMITDEAECPGHDHPLGDVIDVAYCDGSCVARLEG